METIVPLAFYAHLSSHAADFHRVTFSSIYLRFCSHLYISLSSSSLRSPFVSLSVSFGFFDFLVIIIVMRVLILTQVKREKVQRKTARGLFLLSAR